MKIALVCKVYPTQRPGGMGFVCQDRADELVRQGHEVHVITTGYRNGEDRVINHSGVVVHHVPCTPVEYSDQFALHCQELCSSLLPDIIHLDSFDNNRPWWMDVNKKSSCRTAITLHGFSWGSWLTRLNLAYRDMDALPPLGAPELEVIARERRFLTTFDQVIGISLHEHWMMRQMYAIFDSKLVYNPIAPYFFRDPTPPSPKGNRPRYLCAAVSGHHERGFRIAEETCKRINAELVVASSIPRSSMPELIDSCHGVILPTAYAQGLDLTVAEAMARFRPVFVTATGSYLREGEPGGAYYGSVVHVPLMNCEAVLASALGNPPIVSCNACLAHRPETHVKNWLEAIL